MSCGDESPRYYKLTDSIYYSGHYYNTLLKIRFPIRPGIVTAGFLVSVADSVLDTHITANSEIRKNVSFLLSNFIQQFLNLDDFS
jgi:hypothetical protein